MRGLSLLALAAPLVSAIQLIEPTANVTLTKGETIDLKWTTVDTDPSSFSIYLVNFVNWPPLAHPLVYDVETSAGEASVKIPCFPDNAWGYQLYVFHPLVHSHTHTHTQDTNPPLLLDSNAINGTNTYIIYAQTPKFYVGGDACTDPEPTPSCAAATVTVTVRKSKNGGGDATSAPPASSVTNHPLPGKCPDTIGWGPSGYDNPVTVDPPRGAGDVDAPATTSAPPGAWSSKDGGAAVTSTITRTVYKDLSECI